MKKRTITGAILFLCIAPLVVVEKAQIGFEILMLVFSLVGTWELLRMFSKDEKFSLPAKGVIYLSTLLVYFAGLSLNIGGKSILMPLSIEFGFAFILLQMVLELSLLVFSTNFDAKSVAKAVFISLYLGLGCSSLASIRIIGIEFIIYLFSITMFTDIFAYVYGCLFGRHKMAPNISPKKSYEGAIAGTIVATTFATLFAFNYGNLIGIGSKTIFDSFDSMANMNNVLKIVIIIIVTVIASICGQIGDLVASKLKRTYGVKDYSNLFPGHGGFLDRFDSATFTAMFLLAAFLIVSLL